MHYTSLRSVVTKRWCWGTFWGYAQSQRRFASSQGKLISLKLVSHLVVLYSNYAEDSEYTCISEDHHVHNYYKVGGLQKCS